MTGVVQINSFNCGHGRTPENSYVAPSAHYAVCALCRRVAAICAGVVRDQARINAGEPLRRRQGRILYVYG